MKNLLLTFSSFHVSSDKNFERENEYFICYDQLLRLMPKSFDLVFIDNTTKKLEDIKNNNLKNLLASKNFIFYDFNLGQINKGLGELEMLFRARSAINFSNYKNVSYLTGRRIITCPYIFEKTDTMSKEALLSNPPLIRVCDGHVYESDKNSYNDMFFSMRSDIMNKYIDFSEKFLNVNNKEIGSEQILYKFVNEHQISYEWLEFLGMIRNDWNQYTKTYTRNYENFQYC
jgi:hypothetical protein